jgi:hypothetical protein
MKERKGSRLMRVRREKKATKREIRLTKREIRLMRRAKKERLSKLRQITLKYTSLRQIKIKTV